MSTTIDQKAYLQKYLSGPSGDKKNKKKKASKGQGFKIIDDDIDLSKLRPLDGDELDILGEGEDAPQIAGIIDDRPEELKKLEQFNSSSKWRVINQDDGFNSKLTVEEVKCDMKEKEKENELIFGKMYSDSEDDKKNDSDLSPPRKHTNNTPKDKKLHSDSDFSPPKRKEELKEKHVSNKYENNNYDLSPPRGHSIQKNKVRARKPSRWEAEKEPKRKQSPDSDISPPRKPKRDKSANSKRSPKRRKSTDSDISPPRKSQKFRKDPDVSPTRKNRSNADLSLRRNLKNKRNYSNSSPPRKSKHNNSDSDLSPPRQPKLSLERHKHKNEDSQHRRRELSLDSDVSPPRRNKEKSSRNSKISPDRSIIRRSRDVSSHTKDRERDTLNRSLKDSYKRNYRNDSPPPTNKKMEKTLEGKKAGLQDATQLKEENDSFRKREDEVFSRMNDEVSGRNAQVVSRKNKKETSEERQKQIEKANRQKELDEKYKKWSKGIKQLEDQEARTRDFLHESSKPLARFKGDTDLEASLRNAEREGDTMLEYIRENKRKRGELLPEKPTYKGNFPPNRFNIRPGYRWDGVDRSNGYEKKYFEEQSKRKALQDEAYKWCSEDL